MKFEIAESLNTGKIVTAEQAWDDSHKLNPETKSANNFRCPDLDHCGCHVTLVNWGKDTQKRLYFRQSHNDSQRCHQPNCIFKTGTDAEINSFLNEINHTQANPITTEEIFAGRTIFTDSSEQNARNDNNDDNHDKTSFDMNKSSQPQHNAPHPLPSYNHSEFSTRKLTSIATLAKMYDEDPDTLIGGIKWPSRKSWIKGLSYTNNVRLSSFVIDLDKPFQKLPTNQIKVFMGHFWINQSQYSDQEFYLKLSKFENKDKLKYIQFNIADLSGMPNAPKVRHEIINNPKSKKPRVVYLVGSVYEDKTRNQYIFIPRLDRLPKDTYFSDFLDNA